MTVTVTVTVAVAVTVIVTVTVTTMQVRRTLIGHAFEPRQKGQFLEFSQTATGSTKLDLEVRLSKSGGTTGEYMELLIQFGYIVMFAAVAPWASFFCVLINQFDLRADGWKMLYGHQRDRYDGTTTSIGIWLDLLEGIKFFAVVTNCLLIG